MQRDVGFNLVADAAYVGNAGTQPAGRPATSTAGRTATPISRRASIRRTSSGGQPQPLPDDFLRPYQGFGAHPAARVRRLLDYHSLQFSVNRRRSSDGLSVGAAYTYQLSNKNLGAIDPFVEDNRARNYTLERPPAARPRLNYSYEVPEPEQEVGQHRGQGVFDNWQFSGVTTITSGTYGGLHLQLRERADRRAQRHRRDQRRRAAASTSSAIRTCRGASAPSSGSSGPSASRRRPISSASAPR